jgi:hypothetical protein
MAGCEARVKPSYKLDGTGVPTPVPRSKGAVPLYSIVNGTIPTIIEFFHIVL